LINPVLESHATRRAIILPVADNWIDFWSGQTYQGGQNPTVDAPLDRLPILVKAGSIVPLGPVIQSVAQQQDPLEIRIYSGKDASFELYEDGGDGYAYEHSARATIHFQWDESRQTLSIADRSGSFPGMLAKRTFHIVLVKAGHGVGDESTPSPDRIITYDGGRLQVDLAKKN
jgi:alpha-D-xyloside xylohydrolase